MRSYQHQKNKIETGIRSYDSLLDIQRFSFFIVTLMLSAFTLWLELKFGMAEVLWKKVTGY